MKPMANLSAVFVTALCLAVSTAAHIDHSHEHEIPVIELDPRAFSDVHHECIHDTDEFQRALRHGMDDVVPQMYRSAAEGHSFHQLSVSGIRIAISTLDLFNTSRYCTAVGQVIPNMQGGTITCTSSADILTETKRQILINTILPRAIELHSSRLKVTPVSGNLIVSSTSTCSPFTIPVEHTTVGVPDADMVIYVSGAKTSGSTVAWAGYCQLDQFHRPVVGRLNYNPYYITNSTASALEKVVRIGGHELAHALGFSYSYLNGYFPHLLTTGDMRGKSVTLVNATSVVAAARNHFNCSSLSSYELEDEGGTGTVRSHWERRNNFEDMMSGSAGLKLLYTNVTLGLFHDTGVYVADFSKAETPMFAKNFGCAFLDTPCLSDANPAKDLLFCRDTTDANHCSYDFLGVGRCKTNTSEAALPLYAQYFADPTLGGTTPLVDHCPMVEPATNLMCNDSNSNTPSGVWGTYYGPQGRCVASSGVIKTGFSSASIPSAMCVQMRCVEGVRIQFALNESGWTDCPHDGRPATISAPLPYNGNISCPAAAQLCTPDLFYALTPATPAPITPATPTPPPTPAPTTLLCPTVAGAGLFLEGVDWRCNEPFDCMMAFCLCVGSATVSTDCVPFSSTLTSQQVQECIARRVECTLNAAIFARSTFDHSCREWGTSLAQEYEAFRSANSTNITDICAVEMCHVVSLGVGNTSAAAAVNLEQACSLSGYTPADPQLAVCSSKTERIYFDELPLSTCASTKGCVRSACVCLNGTFNEATADCGMPDQPPTNAKACVTTGLYCIVQSALDVYIPGASPFDPSECVAWSVPIAQDYAAYFNAATATAKRSTLLYKSCNFTACSMFTGGMAVDDFAAVCDMPATVRPSFVPFNPCPYRCPDDTCAYSLAACACTRNATVGNLTVVLSRSLSAGTLDVTNDLSATAYATYSVPSGNCSAFDFRPALRYKWVLTVTASGIIEIEVNASSLYLPKLRLAGGANYTLRAIALGLLQGQRVMQEWNFTAIIPPPAVTILGGSSLRVGNQAATSLVSSIIDASAVAATGTWSCVVVSGGNLCPSLNDATTARLIIPAGSSTGTFRISLTYKGVTANVTLEIVAGSVPLVNIVAVSTSLTLASLRFLASQSLVFGAAVSFASRNFTYTWSVNDVVKSVRTSLAVPASELLTTTLSDISTDTLSINTVKLRVSLIADAMVFGEASVEVVVIAPLTLSLTVVRIGGGASAEALTDQLALSPSIAGGITSASNSPFGATVSYLFDYFDNIGKDGTVKEAAVGLSVVPSDLGFAATAPLHAYLENSKVISFRLTVLLNSIRAGSVNSTFSVSKPADLSAAASRQLAQITTITDPSAAVGALNNIRALIALSSNNTLKQELAAAAVAFMVQTLTNRTTLSATEQASAFVSIATAFGALSADARAAKAAGVASIILSTVSSGTFDFANTESMADAVDSFDEATAAQSSMDLGPLLTADPNLGLGQAGKIARVSFVIQVMRQTVDAILGAEVGEAGSATATLPSSLSELGLAPSQIVGAALTTMKRWPKAGDAPNGNPVSMHLTKDGNKLRVDYVASPFKLKMPAGTGACFFYNETTSRWSSTGLSTSTDPSDGGVVCTSSHLTSFGTFASVSSASSIFASLLVMALALVLHLLTA